MFNVLRLVGFTALALAMAGCTRPKVSPDVRLQKKSSDYLEAHLAWRPAIGMGLGLHQYDGRISDFSRASLRAELRRLKQFDAELAEFDPEPLGREAKFDDQLLQSLGRSEISSFEKSESYWKNPMTYAQGIDLTQYIKRNFSPFSN